MDKIYVVEDVAEMFNVSFETVRRWIRTGELKGICDNSRKRGCTIYERDLMVFMDEHPKYKVRVHKSGKFDPLKIRDLLTELTVLRRQQRFIDKEIDRVTQEIERLSSGEES